MPKIKKQYVTWEEFNAIQGGGWTPASHTHIKIDITDTPWAWTDVSKTGSNLTDLATRQHAGLSDAPADAHHAESHTLTSHSTKAHSELSDAPTDAHHVQDHQARHNNAGADALKLDDLATPDDNADLNASISRHGLFRKLSNNAAQCLNGVGSWLTLYDSTSIIIQILSTASATTRNNNDTEQNLLNIYTYTKIKETRVDEPTGVMRIYFEMKSLNGAFVYGKIYKNGSPIGTERSTNSTSYQTYTEDLGGFDSSDLIQIYAKMDTNGPERVYVRNLRFQYDRAITMLGECTLTTPITITTQNPFDMTHQDP